MRLLSLAFALSVLFSANASHIMGGDISYRHLGGDWYEINMILYRDCSGVILSASQRITVSNSCGESYVTDVNLIAGSGVEVSPLCPADLSSSSCNGGGLPGVEKHEFSGVFKLPSSCSDWTFSFQNCCRNNAITNLQNAGTKRIHIEANLYRSVDDNNSAVFNSLGTPFICANELYSFSHSAVDADGDSISFSLIRPREDAGTPFIYTAGYSLANPILPSVTFDNQTGQLEVTPSPNQVAVVSIVAEEFRNGTLIGTTMRDIQIVVLNCSNTGPEVSDSVLNLSGGILLSPGHFQICSGETLSFTATAKDNEGDGIILIDADTNAVFTGASIVNSYFGDSATLDFSWTPDNFSIGTFVLNVFAEDDNCPEQGVSSESFLVTVLPKTDAGPDKSYCPSGISPVLEGSGGTSYTWSLLGGGTPTSLSCINCPNPIANPTTTTSYVVNSNAPCSSLDTVTVFVVPDISAGLSVFPDTACLGDSVSYEAQIVSSEGPHNFTWITEERTLPQNSASITLRPSSNQLVKVFIEGANGCVIADSIEVPIDGNQLEVKAEKDTSVCFGDTVSLDLTYLTRISGCGLASSNCSGFDKTHVVGNEDGVDDGEGPFPGNRNGRIQMILSKGILQSWGVQPGFITSLAVNILNKRSSSPFEDYTIKMACISDSAYNNRTYLTTGLQTVFNPKDVTTTAGWNTLILDNHFEWSGDDHILVDFCYNNPSNFNTGDEVEYFNTTHSSFLTYTHPSTPGCNLTSSIYRYQSLPKMRLGMCNPDLPVASFNWQGINFIDPSSIRNPRVVVAGNQNYVVSVDDGSGRCSGFDTVSLRLNNSVEAVIVGDSCSGPAQLNAIVTGSPKTLELTCGANGVACPSPSQTTVGKRDFPSGISGPFSDGVFDARYQYLYNKTLLNDGGLPGNVVISGFYINIESLNGASTYNDFTIRMGCTNDENLSISTGWLPTSVVWNTRNYTATAGVNYFAFDQPFNWDGNSNIILDICFDNDSRNTSDQVAIGNYFYDCNLYYGSFSTDGSGCSGAPNGLIRRLPMIDFEYCPAPLDTFTYQWTPAAGLNDPTIQNPIANPGFAQMYKVSVFGGECLAEDSVFLPLCPALNMQFLSFDVNTSQNGNPELTWSLSESYDSPGAYSIMRAREAGNFKETALIPFGGDSYRYEDFYANEKTKYYYKIEAEINGEIVKSAVLEWNGNRESIQVYPNPATDLLFVNTSTIGESILELYSVNGKLIHSYSLNAGDNQINIESLRKGVYYYRISGSAVFSGKIMKD